MSIDTLITNITCTCTCTCTCILILLFNKLINNICFIFILYYVFTIYNKIREIVLSPLKYLFPFNYFTVLFLNILSTFIFLRYSWTFILSLIFNKCSISL